MQCPRCRLSPVSLTHTCAPPNDPLMSNLLKQALDAGREAVAIAQQFKAERDLLTSTVVRLTAERDDLQRQLTEARAALAVAEARAVSP